MISNDVLAAPASLTNAHVLGGHFACSQTSQSRLTGQRFKSSSLHGAGNPLAAAARLPAATKLLHLMNLHPREGKAWKGQQLAGVLLLLAHSSPF